MEPTEPCVQIRDSQMINLLTPDYSSVPFHRLVWAISHLNRFTGHIGSYSVAQHSVHVMEIVQLEMVLSNEPPSTRALDRYDSSWNLARLRGALLHDLHEAVVGDVSTPLKDAMEELGFDFREKIEARHMEEVLLRWRGVVDDIVHDADLKMACAEADRFLGGRVGPWSSLAAADILLECWTPEHAFSEFMRHASMLGIKDLS